MAAHAHQLMRRMCLAGEDAAGQQAAAAAAAAAGTADRSMLHGGKQHGQGALPRGSAGSGGGMVSSLSMPCTQAGELAGLLVAAGWDDGGGGGTPVRCQHHTAEEDWQVREESPRPS